TLPICARNDKPDPGAHRQSRQQRGRFPLCVGSTLVNRGSVTTKGKSATLIDRERLAERHRSRVTRLWSKAKTTAAARSRSWSLVKTWLMCVLTVPSL